MTASSSEAGICSICGWFHSPDYSDVIDTPREWIRDMCMTTRETERVSDGAVLVTAKMPDGKSHQWVTTKDGEHVQPGPYSEHVHPKRMPLHVKFVRIHGHAVSPIQAYRWDAGFDLAICQEATLEPGKWQNLHTGIVAAIPEGYWGHILARSSTWRKLGIRVEPAVIDSGYRGELLVYAVNTNKENMYLNRSQRLAQIAIIPLPRVEWIEQRTLPPGERGDRGYGSSG